MRPAKLTINNQPVKTPLMNFLFAQALPQAAARAAEIEAIETVRCDICSDDATATRRVLLRQGWGLYDRCSFCPVHEEMV